MAKVIDNFDLLAKKLFEQPLNDDEFYFLQILVRGKDGHKVRGNNKNRLIQYYTITSKEQLLNLKNEMVALCRADNARAYIHPTRRSFKAVANVMFGFMVKTYTTGNWKSMRSLFSTSCGRSYIAGDKKFIIDLDNIHPESSAEDLKKYNDIVNCIKKLRGHGGAGVDKVFATVPTKSGVHLITYPFDEDVFKEMYPDIDVHKNNPTLLYYEYI